MWNEISLNLQRLLPFRSKASVCGHRTKQTGTVSAHGRTIITKMPKLEDGRVAYCLDCIGTMAIQCAWCGNPIFIGDPITLYTPNKEFDIPAYAVRFSEDPVRLVGCLGWNCADTGADRGGFWMPGEDGKGRVQRFSTIYEAILGSKEPVVGIISDTHDLREAVNPTLIPLEQKSDN